MPMKKHVISHNKLFTYSRMVEVHSEILILSLEFSADKLSAKRLNKIFLLIIRNDLMFIEAMMLHFSYDIWDYFYDIKLYYLRKIATNNATLLVKITYIQKNNFIFKKLFITVFLQNKNFVKHLFFPLHLIKKIIQYFFFLNWFKKWLNK